MNPLVSIIILNWNGWQDTLECLESVYQITYPNYQVILVDNHSEDSSLEKIHEYCQGKITTSSPFFKYTPENKPIKIHELTNQETEQQTTKENHQIKENTQQNTQINLQPELTLIKNEENYGFAKGNNIAIKYALKSHKPDYILLLNNDTVVDPKFLTNMVQIGENDPEIGILGPLIYYYDWKGSSNVVANLGGKVDVTRYPGYYDLTEVSNLEDYNKKLIECDWVSGAALMLKTQKVPVKFLNEKLFFGCEDIDLAILLNEQGYKSVIVLDSHIWHKEGVSRKKRSSDAIRRALMEIKSNLTFLKAHNNHYYWYLPLYFLQIVKIHLFIILRINSD